MHRTDKLEQSINEIRSQAILDAEIGILILEVADGTLRILDANEAFGQLSGHRVADLENAPFSVLYGPRTNPHEAESMQQAAASQSEWRDTIVLQRADYSPLPVLIRMSPKSWPGVDGQLAVATVSDATAFVRAKGAQALSHVINTAISRPVEVESQAAVLARAMVRFFADWCVIHLRMDGGDAQLVTYANRTGREPSGDLTTDISRGGIGKVINSGLPLLYQPSHRVNRALSRQMEAITGEAARAVASVPIAASSLEAFGAITWAITDDRREYDHEDVQTAEDVGIKFGHYLEEYQIRESLARAVRAREAFMKAAGHELRTPLVSIKGYTQLLLRDFRRQTVSAQRLEAGLKAIDTSTSRLTDLMEDLFAVSNQGSNAIPLRIAHVELQSYIEDFLSTTPSLIRSDHEFELRNENGPILVRLDPTRFSQVLFNVCTNAVRFSPAESSVYITITREEKSAVISIRDQGRGLEPGEEMKIFDPFSLAGSPTDGDDQGLGIGLYITKQIVNRHSGEIWAESPGAGKGTTFHIRLPLAPEELIDDR